MREIAHDYAVVAEMVSWKVELFQHSVELNCLSNHWSMLRSVYVDTRKETWLVVLVEEEHESRGQDNPSGEGRAIKDKHTYVRSNPRKDSWVNWESSLSNSPMAFPKRSDWRVATLTGDAAVWEAQNGGGRWCFNSRSSASYSFARSSDTTLRRFAAYTGLTEERW